MKTPLQHSMQLLLHIIPQISPVSFTNESSKNVLKDQTLCNGPILHVYFYFLTPYSQSMQFSTTCHFKLLHPQDGS